MKLKPKRLNVFPNPWGISPRIFGEGGTGSSHTHTFDALGRPCGVCPMDPLRDAGEPGRLVGTYHDAEFIDGERSKGDFRHRRQRTGYSYLGVSNSETRPFELADELAKKEPVSLVYTGYYVERLQDGALLAADEATAKVAGIEFIEPKKLFPLLAKAAADSFNSQYDDGVDAYAILCAERADAKAAQATTEANSAEAAPKPAKKSEKAR